MNPEVKVLIKGKHEKIDDILRIKSTVTLIKSDKNILVDTGSFLERQELIDNLKKEKLTSEDIDIVVLSHLHLDHVVNVDLFNKAQIFCKFNGNCYPGQVHTPFNGELKRIEIQDGVKIAENVEFLLTPGHSNDMVSVLIKTDEGNVVVAGDGIPSEDWADLNKAIDPILVNDVGLYNSSRKKILDMADYIIPGHGNMFKVKK